MMDTVNAAPQKFSLKTMLIDLSMAVLAGVLVSVGLHYFANYNHFFPGGLSGVAFVLSDVTNISRSVWLMILNLPLFIAMSILVDRKLGFYLSIYVLVQSAVLTLLEHFHFPYYQTQNNLIFAAIGAGVVSGMGFALMMRHFGASGGTFAISALVKRRNPGANVAWMTFALDSSVVLVVFFLYGCQIEPALCTLVNLFLADAVVDEGIKGMKVAYRFEIVSPHAEKLGQEIMERSHHGVTVMQGEGLYTHQNRQILVCIVRKRHVSEMIRLLRSYPDTFTSFSKVNEVFGRFHK